MRRAKLVFAIVGYLALLSSMASAQTNATITGEVVDNTGGLLPGVTVEASSPALIEGSRVAITGGEGRYTITDLRPGIYAVTFTLPGFGTLVRDGLELTGAMSLTVNGELQVGSIEETVTVSGQSAVVDVQQAQRVETLSREVMDALPTARNIQSIGALMPGVKLDRPDVGGARAMEQTYMTVHGADRFHVTVQVDGMKVNSLMTDGSIQTYHNDAMHQEVSYQTSGISAETSAGGLRLNMIPKEGGNFLSGAAYIGGSDGSWQTTNITPELVAKGVTVGDAVSHISDVNLSLGGPIVRDKLWYFGSYRRLAVTELINNAFFSSDTGTVRGPTTAPPVPTDRQADQRQWIQNGMLRLTFQPTERNKITAYLDRIVKFKEHEGGARWDYPTATYRRDPVIYYTAQAKWTSPVSNRLLLEAGYSSNVENVTIFYQPGLNQPVPSDLFTCPATPCANFSDQSSRWYAQATNYNLISQHTWNAPFYNIGLYPERFVLNGSASYVTGSHSFKFGTQWDFGPDKNIYTAHGDVFNFYVGEVENPSPLIVTALNTPVNARENLVADLGIYAQDSWTIDRLTLTPGIRFEYFKSEIDPNQAAPAGRFVGARIFDDAFLRANGIASDQLPTWSTWAPRFGAAYDLFGDAQTAVKFSVGRYFRGQTTSWVRRYNPMFVDTDVRLWFDTDFTGACPAPCATNGDRIAQVNEIGPRTDDGFGQLATRRPDPDIKRRGGNWAWNAGVQHALFPRVSVSLNYYRRTFFNFEITDNILLNPDDFTTVNVPSPDAQFGDTIPVRNLNPDKLGQVQQVDRTFDSDLAAALGVPEDSNVYNGVELGFNGRLPNGGAFFGGWSIERQVLALCGPLYDAQDSAGYRFCNQRDYDIPWLHEFKLSGSYPLPFGINLSMALQSYAGDHAPRTWTVPASAFTAVGAVQTRPSTTTLDEPGTRYLPRWNQLDLGIVKVFNVGGHQVEGLINFFNLTNSSTVISENDEFGSADNGEQLPNILMQPRILRIGMQWRF